MVPISYGEFKVRYCFGIVTETRTFYLHTQSQQSFDYWINFLGKQKAKTTPPVSPRSRNEESSYQGKQQEMKQETANLNVQPGIFFKKTSLFKHQRNRQGNLLNLFQMSLLQVLLLQFHQGKTIVIFQG